MTNPHIQNRYFQPSIAKQLEDEGYSSLLARVLAARGIENAKQIKAGLADLIRPDSLKGLADGVGLLVNAINNNESVVIVGDYDCDGATATALTVKVLRKLGLSVQYIVPSRETMGYGLSPAVVEHVLPMKPALVITVDNGIASHAGVELLKKNNIKVLITDHHLPAETSPIADAIVNPNQHNCSFPSKALAGVGVVFYLLIALRQELEKQGKPKFSLGDVLDLVAIGTVADLVPLDSNNRILVASGLARMRANQTSAGIKALMKIAGVRTKTMSCTDIAFYLAPRINAAGRLADMTIGIELLLCDDQERAGELAQMLDGINKERRRIEQQMREEAVDIINKAKEEFDGLDKKVSAHCLFNPDWHIGVVGIVASRIKEFTGKPAFIFAEALQNKDKPVLRGSGRSIEGLHLRDCLDLMAKIHPDLFLTFGGHAMAAGASIELDKIEIFKQAFNECVKTLLPKSCESVINTDDKIYPADFNLRNVEAINEMVWGQGFSAPLFFDEFAVEKWQSINGGHYKLMVKSKSWKAGSGRAIKAMFFSPPEDFMPSATTNEISFTYTLNSNEYMGNIDLYLKIVKVIV